MEDTDYVKQLNEPARRRYREKITAHIGYDPYQLKKSDFSRDLSDLPAVEAMDITSYLVLHTSYYTASQMKAYKSMEAFNYFVCGWVNDLGTKTALNKCRLVFARVNHSQRSGETPLKTWIVAKEDGEVVTAHCNCMAGLSESCSHVGAVLFAIKAGVKMRETASCTTEKCKWLMPSHVKKIPAAPVAMIDFSSAKSKKQNLDDAIAGRTGMDANTRQLPESSMKEYKVCTTRVSAVKTAGFG
ncbi:uncharacterized protein LOC117542824 isoform X4 [Gymnodraco acuticeps]|uniref:Uncharacterized protein LOC117542824 isoform X4 n=1 Tax=Gymnodraco acuticeps TaxID=8218 RepID=A0A6P8TQY4_GYMAC|nr:uncharacterized protein LOC117542824 isoform X4 [Gymnodraco acuticeps]